MKTNQTDYLSKILKEAEKNTLHGHLTRPSATLWYRDQGERSEVLSIGPANPDIEDHNVYAVSLLARDFQLTPELCDPDYERITPGLKYVLSQLTTYLHSCGKLDNLNGTLEVIDSYGLRENPRATRITSRVLEEGVGPVTSLKVPVLVRLPSVGTISSIDDSISDTDTNPVTFQLGNCETGYGGSGFAN